MPFLSALSALNVYDLRKAKAPEAATINFVPPVQGHTTPFTGAYSLSHPRTNDSEGVPAGTSPLGKHIDVCW